MTPASLRQRRAEDVADVQEFHARHGRVPRVDEMQRKNGLPCYRSIKSRWPSGAALVRAAGFAPRPKGHPPEHRCPTCQNYSRRAGAQCRACRAAPTPPVARSQPSARRYLLRTDFLLALPEMRRELEQQCARTANRSPGHVEPCDPARLFVERRSA